MDEFCLEFRLPTGIVSVAKTCFVSVVQGISTGKYHAAVMTNSEQWEVACVRAGRSSGDLAHPLVYCPELHFSEFTSAIADMKNSVAVRLQKIDLFTITQEETVIHWFYGCLFL